MGVRAPATMTETGRSDMVGGLQRHWGLPPLTLMRPETNGSARAGGADHTEVCRVVVPAPTSDRSAAPTRPPVHHAHLKSAQRPPLPASTQHPSARVGEPSPGSPAGWRTRRGAARDRRLLADERPFAPQISCSTSEFGPPLVLTPGLAFGRIEHTFERSVGRLGVIAVGIAVGSTVSVAQEDRAHPAVPPALVFGSGAITAATVCDADPAELAAAVWALSKHEVAALDRIESEAFVLACERITAAVEARQSLGMDTFAGCVEDDRQRQREESGLSLHTAGCDAHGLVASALSPALHCATRSVQRRLVGARWLACEFDATFDAAWDGDLERRRAEVVVEAGLSVAVELRGAFEALVLESSVDEVTGEYAVVSDRVRELSRSELAARATKIARELDPDSEAASATRARDARRVVVRPDRGNPGMSRWVAVLPVDTSQRMAAAVDALAGEYARANAGSPIETARADALADLVLSSAEVSTVIELLVPVPPAPAVLVPRTAPDQLGAPDQPGRAHRPDAPQQPTGAPDQRQAPDHEGSGVRWVIPGVVDDPRHGVLAPEVIARLLSDPDVGLRLARLEPDGSIVQDPSSYRPGASVRRRVRSRDGGCRFPGCHVPAQRTDLDHVVAFPHGPTDPANLVCLCRTHHGFKHHGGWTLSLTPDGSATWRAPDGRRWVTAPRPHGIREDLRLTSDVDAEQLHQLRRGWLPGLPVGLTAADLIVAERCLPPEPTEHPHTPAAPADWEALDRIWTVLDPAHPEPLSALERQWVSLLALAA